MNEQANTALIQSMYAAFGRGDIRFIADSLASDIEWTLEGPEIIPYAGRRHGVDQVLGFFHAMATTLTGPKLTITDIVAQGDKVAAFGRFAATVTATGKRFDSQVAHLFQIRDGKVSNLVDVVDTAAEAEAYRAP
jgi:hypothetical protein